MLPDVERVVAPVLRLGSVTPDEVESLRSGQDVVREEPLVLRRAARVVVIVQPIGESAEQNVRDLESLNFVRAPRQESAERVVALVAPQTDAPVHDDESVLRLRVARPLVRVNVEQVLRVVAASDEEAVKVDLAAEAKLPLLPGAVRATAHWVSTTEEWNLHEWRAVVPICFLKSKNASTTFLYASKSPFLQFLQLISLGSPLGCKSGSLVPRASTIACSNLAEYSRGMTTPPTTKNLWPVWLVSSTYTSLNRWASSGRGSLVMLQKSYVVKVTAERKIADDSRPRVSRYVDSE